MANVIRGEKKIREFAIRLRELRQREGLTQQELASRANVSQRQISLYQTGKSIPQRETLEKLAAALDEDVEFLIHGHSKENWTYLQKQQAEALTNATLTYQEVPILNWGEVAAPRFTSKKNASEKIYVNTNFHHDTVAYRNDCIEAKEAGYIVGSVIVVDHRFAGLSNNSEVVFKYRQNEEIGIRRVLKEAGLPDKIYLVPLLGSSPFTPIEYDELEIEILGKVSQVITPKP